MEGGRRKWGWVFEDWHEEKEKENNERLERQHRKRGRLRTMKNR